MTRLALVPAVALPCALALATTMCGGAPRADPEVASAPHAGVPPAPSASAELLDASAPPPPRTLVLFSPPVTFGDAAITATSPDPTPLVERGQWVYDLRYDKGELYLLGVHRVDLPSAQATPRAMGRFALELYSGPVLVERVRFDFPMLGGPDVGAPDAGKKQPIHGSGISFTHGLTTRVGVMFPATSRGSRLSLWDRATNRRWPLPWPATEISGETHDTPL